MHDGEGSTRSTRAELLAKRTGLALRNRCVIESTSVKGNLIPMANYSGSILRMARPMLGIRLSRS
jgi:hypothetical protein